VSSPRSAVLRQGDRVGQDVPAAARQSRERFVRSAAVAGASLATGAGLLGLRPARASAGPSPAGDVRVLNFILLLEYVQAAFYREASAHSSLGSDLVEYVKTVGGHEDEHVAALRKALGAKARKPPRTRFGRATSDRQKFLAAAIELEDLGVAAYNGQATNLTPATLVPAAEIVSVEARHAAWIRAIAGKLPATGPTDQPLTSRAVLGRLAGTGFVKGLRR
jgi:rubrerythrin